MICGGSMKKKIRVITLVLTVCVLFSGITMIASADGSEWGGKTSSLIEAIESEDFWYNLLKGTYLQSGNSKISAPGGYYVKISGGTDAYQTCDAVLATIYLDRYVNGAWDEIDSAVFTATNTYTVNGYERIPVLPGYYYRARGYHTVRKGSTTETCYTLSDGIWIGP